MLTILAAYNLILLTLISKLLLALTLARLFLFQLQVQVKLIKLQLGLINYLFQSRVTFLLNHGTANILIKNASTF